MKGYKMNITSDDRLEYIDIAKGIGILLVLLGHILNDNSIIKIMIYSFHMPLFFILSGMVTKPQKFATRIKKRTMDILVPYFIWALIFAGMSFKNIILIIYSTNESLIFAKSNGMLWFLPCMFFASLLSGTVLQLSYRRKNGSILLVVCMIVVLVAGTLTHFCHDKVIISNVIMGIPFAIDIVFLR